MGGFEADHKKFMSFEWYVCVVGFSFCFNQNKNEFIFPLNLSWNGHFAASSAARARQRTFIPYMSDRRTVVPFDSEDFMLSVGVGAVGVVERRKEKNERKYN